MLDALPDYQPDEDPIGRIVAAVLGYAIKDGAREIHLQRVPSGRSVAVSFRLRAAENLAEQMKIPIYVWNPLRARFRELAKENGEFHFDLTNLELRISISCRVKLVDEGETLILALE